MKLGSVNVRREDGTTATIEPARAFGVIADGERHSIVLHINEGRAVEQVRVCVEAEQMLAALCLDEPEDRAVFRTGQGNGSAIPP